MGKLPRSTPLNDQVNDIKLVPNMGQIIKVQRPVSSTPIIGLYQRPVSDIRCRIYNSFAGGIIVQHMITSVTGTRRLDSLFPVDPHFSTKLNFTKKNFLKYV